MGTYDTRGGSAASPDAQDETCDGCKRDASQCICEDKMPTPIAPVLSDADAREEMRRTAKELLDIAADEQDKYWIGHAATLLVYAAAQSEPKGVPREPDENMLAAADALNPAFGPPEKLTAEYCRKWHERNRKGAIRQWQAMYDQARGGTESRRAGIEPGIVWRSPEAGCTEHKGHPEPCKLSPAGVATGPLTPVAWYTPEFGVHSRPIMGTTPPDDDILWQPLYAAPPATPDKMSGEPILTDEQLRNMVVLYAMVEGLHAMVYGVYSTGSDDFARQALGDGGSIHEYVHSMMMLLPIRSTEQIQSGGIPDAAPPASAARRTEYTPGGHPVSVVDGPPFAAPAPAPAQRKPTHHICSASCYEEVDGHPACPIAAAPAAGSPAAGECPDCGVPEGMLCTPECKYEPVILSRPAPDDGRSDADETDAGRVFELQVRLREKTIDLALANRARVAAESRLALAVGLLRLYEDHSYGHSELRKRSRAFLAPAKTGSGNG